MGSYDALMNSQREFYHLIITHVSNNVNGNNKNNPNKMKLSTGGKGVEVAVHSLQSPSTPNLFPSSTPPATNNSKSGGKEDSIQPVGSKLIVAEDREVSISFVEYILSFSSDSSSYYPS